MFPSLSFLRSEEVKTNVCECVALPCTLGSELPCLLTRWLPLNGWQVSIMLAFECWRAMKETKIGRSRKGLRLGVKSIEEDIGRNLAPAQGAGEGRAQKL